MESELPQPTKPKMVTYNPGYTFGVVSLTLAVVGVHIGGLIFGLIGLTKSKQAGQKNKPALAGIIVGGVGMLIGLFLISILFSLANQLAQTCNASGPGSMQTINGVQYTCPK